MPNSIKKSVTVSIADNFADYKVKIRNGRRSENLRVHVVVVNTRFFNPWYLGM